MKPATLLLSLGISMMASTAFADQCASGDSIKINDGYSVVAPDGYRFIQNAGSKTTTEPILSVVVVVPSSTGIYSPTTGSYSNVIADGNIVCGYKVGASEGDDSGALLLEKTATIAQSYDLVGSGWNFNGRDSYFCYPDVEDCNFNLTVENAGVN